MDGNLYELDEEIKLEKNKKHNIEIVVDRLVIRPDIRQRLDRQRGDRRQPLRRTGGRQPVVREERDLLFSQNYACEDCGISIEELTPRMFSFNNPFGACPTCTGLGSQLKVDPDLIIPDPEPVHSGRAPSRPAAGTTSGGTASPGCTSTPWPRSTTSPSPTPVRRICRDEVMDVILYGTKGEKLELHYDQPTGQGRSEAAL